MIGNFVFETKALSSRTDMLHLRKHFTKCVRTYLVAKRVVVHVIDAKVNKTKNAFVGLKPTPA